MASVVGKPTTDTMSNAPVFSYAQAARGRSAPAQTQTASQHDVSAPPSTTSLGKDDNASTTNTVATAATSSSASDAQELPKALQDSTDLSNLKKNSESEISSVVGSAASISSSGPVADFRDDAASAAGSGSRSQSQTGEKTQSSWSSTQRGGSDAAASDTRRPRKGKKGKISEEGDQEQNKESTKAVEPVKVELFEAPIPAVNIWQQRKEERAAATAKLATPSLPKTTVPTVATLAVPTAVAETAKPSETVQKQVQSSEESSEQGTKGTPAASGATGVTGPRASRKPADSTPRTGSETLPRRTATRGSRASAKDDKAPSSETVPSVQDATSWPAIELAAADDGKKKAVAAEKAEQDEQASAPKPRQKKEWVAVPITPTYTYETQFTHPKQSRTRGGGRGGREIGARGGHNNNNATGGSPVVEKDAASAAGFVPKPSAEPRERPTKDGNAALPVRQPPQAPPVPKRGSLDTGRDQRGDRPERQDREQRKVPTSATDKPKGEFGIASSSFTCASGKPESSARGLRPELTNGDYAPTQTGYTRRQSGDRREARAHDSSADAGAHHHVSTEGRSERGGRGGYRGRGGHNVGGRHQHQQHQHQHQQAGYGGPNGSRYMGANGIGPQHHQSPFSPTASQYQFPAHNGGRRGPLRSHTGPSHGSQRPPNGIAAPGRMPSLPISTTSQEYPVQPYTQTYPAPLSMGDEYIISGLRAQIEYYFSLENLHKDVYLRARMDSQGFVFLKTIALFKRVIQLAPRFEFIQAACAHSQELDYVIGDDSLERVRSRREMDNFIFPIQDRAEEAQTHGPSTVVFQNLDRQAAYANGYPPHMYTASPTTFGQNESHHAGDHMYHMYGPPNGGHFGHHHAANTNGDYVNGHRYHGGESQLSAAVPDFSPMTSQRPSLSDFQQFPDADIPKLNVILNGSKTSTSGTTAVNGVASSSAETLTNRTGEADGNSKSGDSAKQPAAGSSKYPEFREQALAQRKLAAPGETPACMHDLYKFWIDLLSNTFNLKLYQEFRQLALEDATKQSPSPAGIRYLLDFYWAVFNSRRLYPQEFDAHYHEAKRVADSWASTSGESFA